MYSSFYKQRLSTSAVCPYISIHIMITQERQFYIYALYNKNKPKSDQLLDDFGNSYFLVSTFVSLVHYRGNAIDRRMKISNSNELVCNELEKRGHLIVIRSSQQNLFPLYSANN